MDSFNAKSIGFWIGLIFFITVILLPNPEGLTNDGRLTLAVFLLMGVWWAFEALPLQVTALMPLVFFPLLGVIEIGVISKEYMNKVQFLFAGGFLIAIGIQKWGLHKRVALNILKLSGLNASGIIASFMLASALLSMWVMNTSTAIMLLPVAVSVIKVINDTVKEIDKKQSFNFQLCLLLGIAYSASIGGIATPIGTSPNKMGSSQESCFEYFEVKWLECKRHNSLFHASKCLAKYVGNEYFYRNNASTSCSIGY